MKPSIVVLIATVLIVPMLRADEIRLRSGRVLEGRVVEARLGGRVQRVEIVEGRIEAPEGARIVIERPYGLIEVALEEIVAVTVTEDDFDRADALAKEAGSDLAARLALATWCSEKKLRHRMKEIVAGILEEEPDLEEARALIGEVMTSKGWMSASRARALERMEARAQGGDRRTASAERARLRRLEREMRSLAARIYSQSAKESETAYLKLLELARREKVAGLAPIAARFYRDAGEQRALLAQATVTVNLQQASLTRMRERSINLGRGGAVRVQLPETRKIGLGTTVSVPLR